MMSGEPDAADPEIRGGGGHRQARRLGHREPDRGPRRATWSSTCPAWAIDVRPDPRADPAAVEACFTRLADEGYRQQVEYHPASRFWALQCGRRASCSRLAALLTGFCFWRIRRDLT